MKQTCTMHDAIAVITRESISSVCGSCIVHTTRAEQIWEIKPQHCNNNMTIQCTETIKNSNCQPRFIVLNGKEFIYFGFRKSGATTRRRQEAKKVETKREKVKAPNGKKWRKTKITIMYPLYLLELFFSLSELFFFSVISWSVGIHVIGCCFALSLPLVFVFSSIHYNLMFYDVKTF